VLLYDVMSHVIIFATKLRCVSKNLLVISDDDSDAVIIINDMTDDYNANSSR